MDEGPIHILLVEDDEAHAELIHRALEEQLAYASVTVARGLREARAHLAERAFELVIVDICLPDGNGMDFLPADREAMSYPVVVLTGYGDEESAVTAMKRGALDYVVKSETTLASMPRVARRALREWSHLVERRQAEEALRKAHQELEHRVQERTAELEAANRRLEAEIAERRRTEEILRQTEERFRRAFEDGPIGMAIVSLDRRFLHVNRALCRMLGYAPDELEGQEIAQVTHPDFRETCFSASQQAFSKDVPSAAWEARYIRRDGQVVWAHVTTTTVCDGEGKVVYGLAMIENITERKYAQERLERLRIDLAHMGRVQTLGEMASSIAHELNQPLGAIVIQADVAAQKLRMGRDGSGEDMRGTLDDIAHEAHRAGQIIRRMRDFVKKVDPHRSTVELPSIIDEVLVLVESDLRHAGIVFRRELVGGLPPILADKIQLQQVLLNLIRNAIEAMDATASEARELTVRARTRFGGCPAEGVLEVAVCDTGRGVADRGRDRLFETFYSTKPGGMGMGLAISRSIVEAHGGRIWAAQNPDGGATFTFTLPIVQER